LQGQRKTVYSYGKFRLLFDILILISSTLVLFILFVWSWDYLIILTYIISTLVSFLCFYYLKLVLLKNLSSNTMEHTEVHEPVGRSKGRQTLLLFVVLLSLLATPIIILFLIPGLWLIILNGIVSGVSISELILYFRKRT
jgi:hypothetical protein